MHTTNSIGLVFLFIFFCTFGYAAFALDHPLQEGADLVFSVAEVAAVHKMFVLNTPASVWRVEFERPQEVAGFLEARSDGKDLMD